MEVDMPIFDIFLKLWPAIKDTLFGGVQFNAYFRRNKAIFMLLVAVTITFAALSYTYEQAFLHGAISKKKSQQIAELNKTVSDLKRQLQTTKT